MQDFSDAEKILSKRESKESKDKNRFLYFVNQGVVNQFLGNLDQSNAWFEKAHIFMEDVYQNYARVALSYLVNPNVEEYHPEKHETFLVNYFKAINYLSVNNIQDALVETRRLDIKAQRIENASVVQTKYRKDAFLFLSSGFFYETAGDYNNAFISYRNAYNVYDGFYKLTFGIGAPVQLKADIIRTAALTGLSSEQAYYEKLFGMKYSPASNDSTGDVVLLWHNGLGPEKEQWSITFSVVKVPGAVIFRNYELNLSFTFPEIEDKEKYNYFPAFLRIALPKYLSRPLTFTNAKVVTAGNREYALELAEDLDQVARKALDDRMMKELSQELIRVAIKKATEALVAQKSQGLGAALSLVDAITENADTRNWQTIPHSISYCRMKLKPGKQTVSLNLSGNRTATTSRDVVVQAGKCMVVPFFTF